MSEDQFVVNDPDFNIDYTKHSGEAVVQVFLPSNRFITLMETELRPFVNIFSTNWCEMEKMYCARMVLIFPAHIWTVYGIDE